MTQDEDFHKNILDNLYDAVYFVERRRKITYWNRAAERLTGFAADELVGRRCSDNMLNHVDGKGTALCKGSCPLSKVITEGQPCEAQVYLRHKDGHRLMYQSKAAGRNRVSTKLAA